MKKSIFVLFLMVSLLIGCKSTDEVTLKNNATNLNDTESNTNNQQANTNNVEDSEIIIDDSAGTFTCSAVSQEKIDFTEQGDWITGVTEGFSTTIVEYGDYQ